MSDTSNIFDLPTDPAGGGNNIKISATENIPSSSQNHLQQGHVTLDQTTINQIVSGLQQASVTGATQLPSRDIPQNTNNITQDPQIQPNYIPPPKQEQMDYINNAEQPEDMINNYNMNSLRNSSLDEMYNEIQTPLLLGSLFFLFQLPFFKKFLFLYFPVLFSSDGNLNINGFVFNSVLFGLIFYMCNKITMHFNTF
uniref:Uncharacterized protein n=1 Tax=viral metagenome TaxID=1070528 RepID=A0A6C0IFE0_9ZZZZ